MIKRKYIAPYCLIHELRGSQMLASSPDDEENLNPGVADEDGPGHFNGTYEFDARGQSLDDVLWEE